MALSRKYQKIFGKNAVSTDLSIVGSKMAGNIQYDTDIETLQSLSNWETGMRAIVSNSDAPYLQDHNSLFYVITTQLAYLFQAGIAEWNSQTEYVDNRSLVLKSGKIYLAIGNSTNVEPEVTIGWESSWVCLTDWLLKGVSFNSTVSTAISGYPKGARVLYNDGEGGKYYVESLKNGNTDAPSSANILAITANFVSIKVVNSASELTTPTDPTKIDYALCLGDSLVYMWSTTYQSWIGYQLYRNYVISNLDNSVLYVFNGTIWTSAENEYSWVAYRTNITNNVVGVTKYAMEHLNSGTKDTVYHPIRPTLVVFGATTTQSDRYWYLDVSTDGENFTTIAGYQVRSGDPDSLAMFSIVLDADIYWKVRTNMTNTANYKIQYAYLY